jgi:hypothetical protein
MAKCLPPLARRVLVLTRGDRPVHRSLLNPSLASQEFSHQVAAGQAEFMDRYPPLQELPHEAVAGIVGWLAEGVAAEPVSAPSPEPGGPRQLGRGRGGSPTVEEPVSVPPVGLFGILTYDQDVPASPDKPTAVFLNVANQHHVGPNRLWVELARQWAATGVRSLRLDLSGLGDSPNRQGERGRWECFKPEAFDDVVDAVRWASPDDPSNVVLVGLCSGGYQALESALAVGARGVVAINPFVSFEPAEVRAGLPPDPRRRIPVLDDDLDEAWRARSIASSGPSSGQWLSELVEQGTDTLLVCGDAELRTVRREVTAPRLHRLSRTGGLRVEHLAGLQHDLFIADQRRLVTRLVTEHVLSHFSGQSRQRGRPTGPQWAGAL